MKKNSTYTDTDVIVLSDRDHVRMRLPLYAGNTQLSTYHVPLFIDGTLKVTSLSFVPAAYKCFSELVDNCQDEHQQNDVDNKKIAITYDIDNRTFTIADNGRGVPTNKHESGKYTPEVVFTQLRSGRNFKEGKEAGVVGMNGIGSSMTCMVSEFFDVDISRDRKRYTQSYRLGASEISKPSIRAIDSDKTGTSITFRLDESVFKSGIDLPEVLVHNRAIELALTNPGVAVDYNDNKYKFRKGFEDIIKEISKDYFKFEKNNMEFYVIFDVNENIDEQIFCWVNSSLLFDGGLCNTQFFNAFVDRTISHLEKEAKKQKCEVTKNDIRRNLLILGNLKISDPQYDSQAKTRLTGPTLRKEMADVVDENWALFSRRNKNWLEAVLQQAMVRHHSDANAKAIKDHQKGLNKKISGLMDATSKNVFERQILITEGDSAASMITDARNPKTTASLALSGKVNNVYGSTIAQLLNMGKMTDLLAAIGLVPGHKAVRSNLRYGKIVIATDSDYDGGDIFTLLVNLFFQYWPELFDPNYEPIVYRLLAPNVCLIKGDKRIHFASRAEYETEKGKYKGWTVKYYKGLGSMSPEDWDMILSGKTNTLRAIQDDGDMKKILSLLFSDDAASRKKWLTG